MSAHELIGKQPSYVCFGCGMFTKTLRTMVEHLLRCQEHPIPKNRPVFRSIREEARRHLFLRKVNQEVFVCARCNKYQTLECTAFARHQDYCLIRPNRDISTVKCASERRRRQRKRGPRRQTLDDKLVEIQLLCTGIDATSDPTAEESVAKESMCNVKESMSAAKEGIAKEPKITAKESRCNVKESMSAAKESIAKESIDKESVSMAPLVVKRTPKTVTFRLEMKSIGTQTVHSSVATRSYSSFFKC